VTKLDALIDCKGIMAELMVKRSSAEALMRVLPKVRIGRRVYVKRTDLTAELERRNEAA
jgi:hypothetical protein